MLCFNKFFSSQLLNIRALLPKGVLRIFLSKLKEHDSRFTSEHEAFLESSVTDHWNNFNRKWKDNPSKVGPKPLPTQLRYNKKKTPKAGKMVCYQDWAKGTKGQGSSYPVPTRVHKFLRQNGLAGTLSGVS